MKKKIYDDTTDNNNQPTDQPAIKKLRYIRNVPNMWKLAFGNKTLRPHHISPNKNNRNYWHTSHGAHTHIFFPRIPEMTMITKYKAKN